MSLRILADHGRAMTFLLADGVLPTNEGRGYVLRRQIRRAVRHARLLGFEGEITGPLVDATVETMGAAYPDLVRQHDFLRQRAAREEARFGETLRRGLDPARRHCWAEGDVSGEDAFFLHDTLGFPVEVTAEIAADRGRSARPGRLQGADGGAAAPGPGGPGGEAPGPRGGDGAARWRPSSPTCSRPPAPTSSSATAKRSPPPGSWPCSTRRSRSGGPRPAARST